jgi:adenosylcobinamide-GDP ribazoletransferase
MNWAEVRVARIARDVEVAIVFCTRLPLGFAAGIKESDLSHASWAMPVAGAIVGLIGSLAYFLAFQLRLAPLVAAMIALAATLIVTGALHEDGLADTVDGFGGGSSVEEKLAIMRDSRIGTFGVCALAISLILRWSALATIAEPRFVAMALVAAHVSARATLPVFMRLVPPARKEGLSAAAGRPPLGSAAVAVAIGAIALLSGLGPRAMILSMFLLALAGTVLGWLTIAQIRGQTGDVLGAMEQVGETLVLLAAVALNRA